MESHIPAFCIDLDVDYYPDVFEYMPDTYAIQKIGMKAIMKLIKKTSLKGKPSPHKIDADREMYMAKRLKEFSFSYERILFISGMAHVENVLRMTDEPTFPSLKHAMRET